MRIPLPFATGILGLPGRSKWGPFLLGTLSYRFFSLGINRHILSWWARGVESPPKRIVFRFHYHSQKVIGSLGFASFLAGFVFFFCGEGFRANTPKSLGRIPTSSSMFLRLHIDKSIQIPSFLMKSNTPADPPHINEVSNMAMICHDVCLEETQMRPKITQTAGPVPGNFLQYWHP